jgi:hypothetical protein
MELMNYQIFKRCVLVFIWLKHTRNKRSDNSLNLQILNLHFNNQVQEIMSSILSSSLAFVERLHKTHIEETIYTIDINKCRRNKLLHHKYDYRVFNVMDDVEVFFINSEIIEGQNVFEIGPVASYNFSRGFPETETQIWLLKE